MPGRGAAKLTFFLIMRHGSRLSQASAYVSWAALLLKENRACMFVTASDLAWMGRDGVVRTMVEPCETWVGTNQDRKNRMRVAQAVFTEQMGKFTPLRSAAVIMGVVGQSGTFQLLMFSMSRKGPCPKTACRNKKPRCTKRLSQQPEQQGTDKPRSTKTMKCIKKKIAHPPPAPISSSPHSPPTIPFHIISYLPEGNEPFALHQVGPGNPPPSP